MSDQSQEICIEFENDKERRILLKLNEAVTFEKFFSSFRRRIGR